MKYTTHVSSKITSQVGVLGSAKSLQKELDRIATKADTSNKEGLTYILKATTCAILKHSDYCISGYSSVDFSGFPTGGSLLSNIKGKWPRVEVDSSSIRCNSKHLGFCGDFNLSADGILQETENFPINAINLSFFERLRLAWKIIFPTPASKRSSNANIAKQRLRMILFSDRCAVSDEAKEKIMSNIVTVLSDFVEIESQDKVQLNVSTDADLGTIYFVTVSVRHVNAEYQVHDESGSIMNVEYKDVGERSSNIVDVTFDFYVPENIMMMVCKPVVAPYLAWSNK